jgi:hypothetical protein
MEASMTGKSRAGILFGGEHNRLEKIDALEPLRCLDALGLQR